MCWMYGHQWLPSHHATASHASVTQSVSAWFHMHAGPCVCNVPRSRVKDTFVRIVRQHSLAQSLGRVAVVYSTVSMQRIEC